MPINAENGVFYRLSYTANRHSAYSAPTNTPTTETPEDPTQGELEILDGHIPQIGVDPKNGTIELTGKK